MKTIAALFVALLFSACGGLTQKRNERGFWDQCVKANGYGLNMFSPYGPFNFGYLTWERNVSCDKDIQQAKPIQPAK